MKALALILCAVALSGCTVSAVSEVSSFGPSRAVWALDQQAETCASSRAAGVIVGDPSALAGVPLVGGWVGAGVDALEAERTCEIVRGLNPSERARLRALIVAAARRGQPLAEGAFTAAPRALPDGCAAVSLRHAPSGRLLAPQRLCPDGQGGYVPLV